MDVWVHTSMPLMFLELPLTGTIALTRTRALECPYFYLRCGVEYCAVRSIQHHILNNLCVVGAQLRHIRQ
ncbi:hypothetical protein KDA_38490 [Dictyobacter alpinus]|uniref:Uncharacterized protein n=1 Tax=Dictyobacter alpinus TaxID=2014873 RepID=A0A402BAH6_9CHLR|nr:hypothetical protein KDA_38490 [Dictyobacter alpinus]